MCIRDSTSSLPAPLNLVVSCLGRCAVALKAGAHGTTARGTSPTEFDGAKQRLGGALAALQQSAGAEFAALPDDARQALQECAL